MVWRVTSRIVAKADSMRSKVRPVRGGEVELASQAGGGLGVLVVVALEPLVEGTLGLRLRFGHPIS